MNLLRLQITYASKVSNPCNVTKVIAKKDNHSNNFVTSLSPSSIYVSLFPIQFPILFPYEKI